MIADSFSNLNEFDELLDHIRDGVAQIHARLHKWKCLEELTIMNGYINGHTGILVYLDRVPRPPAPHTGATIWPTLNVQSAISMKVVPFGSVTLI